ncbi:MAG TPA: hypothetical protein VF680_17110 [Allosphingosinicella sp.]|jgi:hypothetical protein
MNQIKCVETRGYKLTEGKLYDPIKREKEFVFIINDSGSTVRYLEELFEKVPGTKVGGNNQQQPAPVVQQAPPPPARTEQDCINSITINNDDDSISYVDLKGNKQTFEHSLEYEVPDMSCGVNTVDGLNDTMVAIHESVEETGADEDLMNLRKSLFRKCILNFVKMSTGGEIILFSTNTNDNDEDLLPIMDEISQFRTAKVVNPNGGNTIKMWGFYKSQIVL